MISGYRCALYDRALAHWRRIDFQAMTRGGPAIESLWLNYAPPRALHDYSHLGKNFRERERIKRKRDRWRRRLAAMPELERAAIRDALELASPAAAIGDRHELDPLAIPGDDLKACTAANDDAGDRRSGGGR